MKIDVEERKCCHTWQEKGCWVTQPEFVSRPNAETEDDGKSLVLTAV